MDTACTIGATACDCGITVRSSLFFPDRLTPEGVRQSQVRWITIHDTPHSSSLTID